MSSLVVSVRSGVGKLGATSQNVLDTIVPPEKRSEILARTKHFTIRNPKLSAFLAAQLAFTGLPLLLFFTFSITVFLVSLFATLIMGLVAASLFTLFMVLAALTVVLPTVFITTFGATFIFLWGVSGYYLLKIFNEGESTARYSAAIGDRMNYLFGGRLSWLTDGARRKHEEIIAGFEEIPKTNGDQKPSTNGNFNGGITGRDPSTKNTSIIASDSWTESDGKVRVTKQTETVTSTPAKQESG